MVKKLIFSALALAYVAGMNAVTLTPEEALARAGKAVASSSTRSMVSSVSPKLSFTQMTEKGAPAVYVFNNDEGGFIVLGADDMAYPVLGYSDAGQLTGEDVATNPALEWWLGEYARQIEYAASKQTASQAKQFTIPSTRADYEAIAPMIKTKWDQGAPYYNQCPMYGTFRTFTGCVATAMAQVMKYWQYPEVGRGQIGYEASTIGKRLSLNFAKKKFDWDNMLPSYYGDYTPAQEDAVAYLMKACGYAVKMDYSPESSGALGMNIANGLQKYFDYDPNMLYTLRDYYTTTQWSDMIYENLKNVGPVLYGGGSFLGGGHSFICDGYDGNGMFHFNWGWSGMSDGYFSLDALNPDALGTGGGSGGGYNFSQDAVLGIQPPTGKPVEVRQEYMTQAGSLGAYIKPIEKTMLHFSLWGEMEPMWVNYNPSTLKVYFGAIFEPQGTTPGEVKKISVCDVQFTIQPGYGTTPDYFDPKVDLLKAGLSDGVYKVTIATFDGEGEDVEWIPVRATYPYCDFVTLKKNGENFEVVVDDIPSLEIVDAGIDGHFYNGCPITVNAKVVNNFDVELTTGLAPAFAYENVICFLGESVMVTVPPHSSVEKEWTTIIYTLQGAPSTSGDLPLTFTFFDEMTYNFYTEDFSRDIVMEPNPGVPVLDYGDAPPVIARLEKMEEIIEGQITEVYILNEKDDRIIDISADLTLKSGYFHYPVYSILLTSSVNEEGNEELIIQDYTGTIMSLRRGRATPFSSSLNLSNCKPDVLYSIAIGYLFGEQIVIVPGSMAYLRILQDNAGVDGVVADSENMTISFDPSTKDVTAVSPSGIASVDIYDLQGKKLRSVNGGNDTIRLEGLTGVVIIRALDNAGHVSTRKLHL